MDRGQLVLNLIENCENILDIGCASGYYTKLYASKCKNAFGVDPNANLIEEAKNIENVNFLVSNGEKLPFEENKFDYVILSDVLEHVENEIKTLNEIHRVLKMEGKVIITVPHKGLFRFLDVDNYSWYMRRFPKFYSLLHRLKGRESPKVKEGYVNKHRHYSVQDLNKLLKNFKIVKYERKGLVTGDLGNNFSLISRWIFNKNYSFQKFKGLDFNLNFGRASAMLVVIAEKA